MKSVRELMGDKRVAAGLAALAVIAVAARFFYPAVSARTSPAQPSPAQAAGQSAAEAAGSESRGISPDRGTAGKALASSPAAGAIAWSWDRNPFVPQWKGRHASADVRATETAAGMGGTARDRDMPSVLRGTVVSGQSGFALFGSRIVPVGERIGIWTVERVERYSVTLRSGGETRVVELFKPMPRGGKGGGGNL
ncbi:MAG: hypothetical protein HY896_07100 [Deltaproteobacteria bacterium]|nr:hypothetical protein [Deltaproteobacteria bacterium]